MTREQKKRIHEMKKRRILKWVVSIVMLLIIGISGMAFSMYNSFSANLRETHVTIHRDQSKQRVKPISFEQKDPLSILLLGVDGRTGESGRSDTIIVLTVNPNTKTTKMLSIPRDTYTEIVGHNTTDKLNHAYAFGGIQMSMDSVEHLLNIPIDYVAEINMDGFSDMIDAVGGITVTSNRAFEQNGYHFKVGTNRLDGKAALAFIRNRHDDPEGDFGRQNRQRQVISGLIKEAASVNSLFNYKNIFNSLGKNVQTNLTFSEIMKLSQNYKDSISNITQLRFEKGRGEMINGIWYYKMDDHELKEVSKELRNQLELP
ncbi:LCP family glycopolymer transferase [Rummeliibacillus pycnus]|uniref:LCP family glycopolymer transferase n=1 Tax=Rummeliibacillus pycnus TaxID=101070 RepID=UPI000C9C8B18|nr:LCP family protein [Rummeliibacillus pycnus]